MNMMEKTLLQLLQKLDLEHRISELVLEAVRAEIPKAVENAAKEAVTASMQKELPTILEVQLNHHVKECITEHLPGILDRAVRDIMAQGADSAYREILTKETERLRESLVEALCDAIVQVTEGPSEHP